MQRATDRELIAAHKIAEALVEFLIAREEGCRIRTPSSPQRQFTVKLPEFPTILDPTRKPTSEQKPPHVDPGQLIDVDKVGALLGCSRSHVYRLTEGGGLPRPRKIGNLVRWSVAEVRKWVEEGCPK